MALRRACVLALRNACTANQKSYDKNAIGGGMMDAMMGTAIGLVILAVGIILIAGVKWAINYLTK